MKGKIEMQSSIKLAQYRALRNYICFSLSKAEHNYEKALAYPEQMTNRKDYLEMIAFYKDVLAVLSRNKELITDAN